MSDNEDDSSESESLGVTENLAQSESLYEDDDDMSSDLSSDSSSSDAPDQKPVLSFYQTETDRLNEIARDNFWRRIETPEEREAKQVNYDTRRATDEAYFEALVEVSEIRRQQYAEREQKLMDNLFTYKEGDEAIHPYARALALRSRLITTEREREEQAFRKRSDLRAKWEAAQWKR